MEDEGADVVGAGLWRPPNLIATALLGPSADSGDFDAPAFTVGMPLHLLTSITMASSTPFRRTAAAQTLSRRRARRHRRRTLFRWGVYQWLTMPWLARAMHGSTSAISLAVAHVAFALGFAAWWIPWTAPSRR